MDKPKRILGIVLAFLIFTSLAPFAAEQQGKRAGSAATSSKTSENRPSVATSVFEQVSKSVVIIEALSSDGRIQGSGVVYDNDRSILLRDRELFDKLPAKLFSYVVTNAHVVKNASGVSVLEGGKRYQADVRYVDDESDLALLYVHGDLLSISPPFSGAQLKVGEKVFAIGSPLGLENSISEGIISGMREQNGVLLLQTTAPVSRGSSGGGLFDERGRFVGVTTFKLVGGENLNFAVDAGRISEIWDALTAAGILRTRAEGHFSPDELAIIHSDILEEWILKTPSENGGKLSTEIKRRYGEAWQSPAITEALDKVRKEHLQVLGRFLSDQPNKSASTQRKAEKVVIVCSLLFKKGDRTDRTFELDHTNRTVDGFPAQFTDAEIRWRYPWSNLDYVLNRYSGSISIWMSSKGITDFISGHCSPPTERKF